LKTLLNGHSCEEVGRESLTIRKRCILLIQLLTVPDTNNSNHNYPSCHNVSCDHQAFYPVGGVRVPNFEIWPVIDYRDQHMRANAWDGIGKEFKIKRKFYIFTCICIFISAFI